MDSIRIIDALMMCVGGLMGWIMKILWDSNREVKAELNETNARMIKLKEDLPETYARRDELKEGFSSINRTLERILDKLDSKQDK